MIKLGNKRSFKALLFLNNT